MHFKREVTPVQTERGERGVVHRGRRGVPDGKAIDRAQARRGVDDGLGRVGHAGFICGRSVGLKRKVQVQTGNKSLLCHGFSAEAFSDSLG